MFDLTTDEGLVKALQDRLFTAVVGDILDKMGYRRQFLPQAIGPLRHDMRIVGRAMPVLEADVFDELATTSNGPLGRTQVGLMMDAETLLHANAHWMAVTAEPLTDVVARGAAITSRRRLPA